MHIDLTGKIALVSGSTMGIGFSIAEGLHRAGAQVVLNGRDDERLSAATARLGSGERVSGVVADVGTAEGCEELFEAVPRVDILVNSAAAFGSQSFLEIEDWKWERLFAVNVLSGVRLSRHYIPQMTQNDWGRIIFISSVDAVQIPVNMVDYGVTKLSQLGVSRGVAETLRGTGVTSNALLVGPTLSDGLRGNSGFGDYQGGRVLEGSSAAEGTLDDAMDALLTGTQYGSSIIGRMASCEEVANMAVYLASEQAAITTGAAIRVDGGVLRGVL
jgi:NAD(P)-dependent dehydrogenase (short-subunit alcohol dehydrogenase family)